MKPNLFNWATSELSQDAFICWLIEWAKPRYKVEYQMLNQIATQLIIQLGNGLIGEIEELEVKKQYKNIMIILYCTPT